MKISVALLILPLLAGQSANYYGDQKEHALEQSVSSKIRQSFPPFGHPAIDAYVNRIGARLIAGLDDRTLPYSFEVVNSVDVVEPLALPDGCILVPARFFLIARDEAEFAGMLAHSVAHAALRHESRTAARANLGSIPLVSMGGWVGLHVDSRQPSSAAMPLAFQSVQRERELEADRSGLQLAARSGYDPTATRRYIDRTQALDSNVSPLPPRDVRLAGMDDVLKSLPAVARSSSDEFATIQSAVRDALGQAATKRPSLLR